MNRSNSSLLRNSVVNVAGQVAPAVAAFVAIPVLLGSLGKDRFGLLTLGWAIVGWFSLFDAGLGRAATRVVASGLALHEPPALRAIVVRVVWLLAAMGLVATLVGSALAMLLIGHGLSIPLRLQTESKAAFVILLLSMPLVLAANGARGALEGAERFGISNLVRAPANATLFLAPLAVLPFSHDMRLIMGAITATRVIALLAFLVVAWRALPPDAPGARASDVRGALSYAGWTGLTNALGTVMSAGYLDRFLIGGILGVAAVPYYSTPFEAVTKVWLLPMALMAVFFPVFSRRHAAGDKDLPGLYLLAIKTVMAPLTLVVIALLVFTHEALALWVGTDIARHSTTVAQCILIGSYVNGLAMVPFTLLQAAGRSDLTAKRHLVQLPLYVPLVYLVTRRWGYLGTSLVWLGWTLVDLGMLVYLLRRTVRAAAAAFDPRIGVVFALLLMGGWAASLATSPAVQIGAAAFLLVLSGICIWRMLLSESERTALLRQCFLVRALIRPAQGPA